MDTGCLQFSLLIDLTILKKYENIDAVEWNAVIVRPLIRTTEAYNSFYIPKQVKKKCATQQHWLEFPFAAGVL